MTLQDIFDQLLVEREIQVQLPKQEAELLRLKLAKKWKKYKQDMDAIGYLSEELAACSLCRETIGTSETQYKFLLRPFARKIVNYTILPTTASTDEL